MLTNEQLRQKYGGTQPSGTASATTATAPTANKKALQWSDAIDAAKNFAIGAAKGLGSTVLGIGELGTKTLGRIIPGVDVNDTSRFADQQRRTTLNPTGMAQKVGFGAEQIAEFFVPAGAAEKIALKGAEAAADVSKVTRVGGSILRNVSRLAPQVAGDVAVSAGQSGGNIKTMSDTAKFSLAGGILGHIASQGLKGLGNAFFLRTVPGTPTQLGNDLRKGLEVGKALSETGVSLTRGSLMRKVAGRINTLGNALDTAVGKVGSNFSRPFEEVASGVTSILKDKEIARALEVTPINMDAARQVIDETLQKYRQKYAGQILNPAEQHQLKQDIGVGLGRAWDRTLGTPIRAEAFTEEKTYHALNHFLQDNVPGYADLNKKMAPLLEAKNRAQQKGAYSGYLTDVIAASMGGGDPRKILEDPVGYFKGAISGILLKRGLTSTAGKTIIGTVANKVGSAVDSPAFYQLIRMLTTSSQKLPPQPNQNQNQGGQYRLR